VNKGFIIALLAVSLFTPVMAQDYGDPAQIVYAAIVFVIVFAIGQLVFTKFLSKSSYPSDAEKRTAIMVSVGLAALVSFFMFQSGAFNVSLTAPSFQGGSYQSSNPFWFIQNFVNTMNPALRIAIAIVLFYAAYDRGRRVGDENENNILNFVLFLVVGVAALMISNPFWELGQAVILMFIFFVISKILGKYVTFSGTHSSYSSSSYDKDSKRREKRDDKERRRRDKRDDKERKKQGKKDREERKRQEESLARTTNAGAFRQELISLATSEGVPASTVEGWVRDEGYYAQKMMGRRNFRKRKKEVKRIHEEIARYKKSTGRTPTSTTLSGVAPVYSPGSYDVASQISSAQPLLQNLEMFNKIIDESLKLNAQERPDGFNMWALPEKCPDVLDPFPDKMVKIFQQGAYTPNGPFKAGQKMVADKGQLARDLFLTTGSMGDSDIAWIKRYLTDFMEMTQKTLHRDFYHSRTGMIQSVSETIFLVLAFKISDQLNKFCVLDEHAQHIIGGEMKTYMDTLRQVVYNEMKDAGELVAPPGGMVPGITDPIFLNKFEKYYGKSGIKRSVEEVIKVVRRLVERYESHLDMGRGARGYRRARAYLTIGPDLRKGLLDTMVKSTRNSLRQALMNEQREVSKLHGTLEESVKHLKDASAGVLKEIKGMVGEHRKKEDEKLLELYKREVLGNLVDPLIKEFKDLYEWSNSVVARPNDHESLRSLEKFSAHKIKDVLEKFKKSFKKMIIDNYLNTPPPADPRTDMEKLHDKLLRRLPNHSEVQLALVDLYSFYTGITPASYNYTPIYEQLMNRFRGLPAPDGPLKTIPLKVINASIFSTIMSGGPAGSGTELDRQAIVDVFDSIKLGLYPRFKKVYESLKFFKEEVPKHW